MNVINNISFWIDLKNVISIENKIFKFSYILSKEISSCITDSFSSLIKINILKLILYNK